MPKKDYDFVAVFDFLHGMAIPLEPPLTFYSR
jgi:hypothetical protein